MLDRLSTDDYFRELFQRDLGAALSQLPGSPSIPDNLPQVSCLTPARLASKADIARTKVLLNRYPDQLGAYIPKLLEP